MKIYINKKKMNFKNRVLFPVVAIFAVSILIISAINYAHLHSTVENKTRANLEIFTSNVLLDIRHLNSIMETVKQTLSEKHLAIAKTLVNSLEKIPELITHEGLKRLASSLDILELNIANSNGILTASNDLTLVGFDYKEYETTNKYMGLLNGALKEIAEEPRLSVLLDGSAGSMNYYVGVPLQDDRGFVQIGFNTNVVAKLRNEIEIERIVAEAKIGRGGYGMVLSEGKIIAHPHSDMRNKNITEEGWYKTVTSGDGFAWIAIDNERYYAGYKSAYNNTVVGLVPEWEYYGKLNPLLIQNTLVMFIAIFIIIAIVYMVLSKLLFPIKYFVSGLHKIAEGDFDTRIEGNYNDELGEIKDAINSMAKNLKANEELAAMNEKLKSLSTTDELTKLNNRRSFMEYADIVWKQSRRLNHPLTVMMLDIDFFKKYNDSMGHLEGDKALIAVAECLREQVKRETDFVARFGGEEFIYLLPYSNIDYAIEFANKLVEDVEKMHILHPMSEISEFLTISVGVATISPNENSSIYQLLDNADKALYAAKRSGRNRAVVYS